MEGFGTGERAGRGKLKANLDDNEPRRKGNTNG